MNPVTRILETLPPKHLRVGVHCAGVTVCLTICVASYLFFYARDPGQEAIWENSIATGEELIKNRMEIAEERDLTECELFAMQRRLEELTALIPHDPESSRFLAQLSQLGTASELEIHNFRPGVIEPADNMQRVRVHLTAAGRYECICGFLAGLQSLPRLTRVAKLQVDPPNQRGLLPVQMELSIFFAAGSQKHVRVARHD